MSRFLHIQNHTSSGNREMANKLLSWQIVLLPITYQLASPVPAISLGELILIPFILYFLVCESVKDIDLPKGISAFYLLPIFTTLFASVAFADYFIAIDAITVIARIVFYFALIAVCARHLCFKTVLRSYFFVVFICSLFLLAQISTHYLLGFDIPIIQELDEFLFNAATVSNTSLYYQIYGFRPAAIFIEPSHVNLYVFPMIAILLFAPKNALALLPNSVASFRIVYAAILSVLQLCTTGTGAIVFSILIWLIFLLSPASVTGVGANYKYIALQASMLCTYNLHPPQ